MLNCSWARIKRNGNMNINLLPWREARRLARKRAFHQSLVLSALLGILIAFVIMLALENVLANQLARNTVLETENNKLDVQVKEIAVLDEELKILKHRQETVKNLQAVRNQPVYLLDEMVDLTPVGVILKSIKQSEIITVTGYAQSNARISEFLHNIEMNSRYLTKPALVESKLSPYGQGKEQRKLFEFTMTLISLPQARER